MRPLRLSPRIAATLLLIAAPAAAQSQPCAERGLDAFASARRARRVIEDYNVLHQAIRRDLDALDTAALTVGQPLPELRFFAAPIADVSFWIETPACYEGARRDANLSAVRFGGIAGGEQRELGLRFEAFWITGGDTLSISIPDPAGAAPSPSGEDPNDVSLGQDQRIVGGRMQIGRWAEVTLGQITEGAPPQELEERQDEPQADQARLYMAFGVPAINLRSDLILSSRDQALQTLYLDLDRLPILETGLAVTARAGYLRDEDQIFTSLGLAIPIAASAQLARSDAQGALLAQGEGAQAPDPLVAATHRFGSAARLYPEVSVEWDDPRLRHGRLRAEVQRTVLTGYEDGDAASVMGAPYVDMGLFWEGTVFNSRALEERVGERWAWGFGGGGRFLFGMRLMSIAVDTSFHLNRPETIAQISELEGVGEWRMLMSWRVGW